MTNTVLSSQLPAIKGNDFDMQTSGKEIKNNFPAALAQSSWLTQWNSVLENKTPFERVAWAMENLPSNFVLSSSFGIQSAVMLHMMTQIDANIPVLLTDTGHLFPETYRFIDEMSERLKLNLHVFSATQSASWQQARYGNLWEQGADELKHYNRMNKVEPLERGLSKLNAGTWFSGVRRQQSTHRQTLAVVTTLRGRFKVHPIIDWSNRDIYQYLSKHDLPYHPLWEQGYVSVGDVHSTKPLTLGMDESDTRFNGLQRECGLHTDGDGI